MKFSENWLRNHVPIQANRDVLVATLTAIGLEVENVAVLGEALDLIVVARIVNVVPHPESDLLQICQVDVAQDNLLQIVCGASNVRPGLVVPLALLGAKIGALTIKSTTLRGVESNGMLCSAKELGLDTEASGLMELPEDAPIGTPLADYLALPDASIEIKLTPNRADCFSVRGIAFDVAAACASEVTPFHIDEIPAVSARTLPVELHAGANAPRYCGCVIEGIDSAAPTPVWMAERLRRSGIRPVSLLVDVTQYVMLELGQPMHAFDVDTLRGPIGVRLSRNDEA
ncbi:MAG TPA: YtpR family tRNA-binding protein, partial [Xylella fastidiosa subsp. multiplex]